MRSTSWGSPRARRRPTETSVQVVRCVGYCYAAPAALDGDTPCTGPTLADQLAFASGAHRGVVLVRSEYPRALARIREAVRRAYADGHFGPSVHGTGRALDVAVAEGAGSYVAGEETALIAGLEGDQGRARPTRPGTGCGMRRPW
ncbi:hypothetical protein ACFXOD_03965 [Streptomyces sp. NPDC059161]|uniref:hypothetical protein n=1 Tax=Streptomyces sp. NPDC059161 TaxID=3346749 RepID=UPI00368C4CB3